ncbi:FadR/GntR family transcriptional regulator [Paenibacillus sp. HB172176]|uniref:FadR/GntR family transcriptional regulator n=1 Tax=Paenibacillus sp. HB172176 TaxID=2493690 RepID=UPI001F0F7436|nr:FadR/GntR family transcriptional regulator [Paenibacillus sp. HB172176]
MKIETKKGHEIVGKAILDKIQAGEWIPGQKLPSVVDLSASFGVGRSTVREALSALKATGWLDIRHGGGTFIKKELPSKDANAPADLFQEADSVLEILEVRMVLETGTAALAAERRTEEDLQRMENILSKMEQALLGEKTSEGEQADVAFHTAIAAASKNKILIQLMDSLTSKLNDTISKTRELWFYQERATAARLLEEHRMLYEAIRSSDAKQASLLIEAHLAKVLQVLHKSI